MPSSLKILGTFFVMNLLYASWLSRIIAASGLFGALRPLRSFAGPGCGFGSEN